jgi:hypothetical protein
MPIIKAEKNSIHEKNYSFSFDGSKNNLTFATHLRENAKDNHVD